MATKPLLLNETGEKQAEHLDSIAKSLEQMVQNGDGELVESDDTEDIAEDADETFRDSLLLKTPQVLTNEEKRNVCNNLGAATVETVLNKVDKNADEGDDGNYIYAQDANNNPIRIPKSTMFSLMADFIKNNTAQQAKVTFGATSAPELASVVAGNIDKIEFQKTLKNTVVKKVTLTAGATVTLTWEELGLLASCTSSIVKASTAFGANSYGLFFVMRGVNQDQTAIEILSARNCSLYYNVSGIILKNDSPWAVDFCVTIC